MYIILYTYVYMYKYINIWIHIYTYIYLYMVYVITFSYTLISKCFEPQNTFPDKHIHFRPAIGTSRETPVVCNDLELNKKEQLNI